MGSEGDERPGPAGAWVDIMLIGSSHVADVCMWGCQVDVRQSLEYDTLFKNDIKPFMTVVVVQIIGILIMHMCIV